MDKLFIFNPAAIDSTIIAALLLCKSNNAKACQAHTPITDTSLSVIHWVGVEPTMKTIKKSTAKRHIGYFLDPMCLETDVRLRMSTICYRYATITANDEIEDLLPTNLFGAVLSHIERVTQCDEICINTHEEAKIWQIGNMLDSFQRKSADIDCQSILFENYNKALMYLAGYTKTFELVTTNTTKSRDGFDEFLKNVKLYTSSAYSYISFIIDRDIYKIPVVNCMSKLAPWVISLLSQTHEFVITYEHRRGIALYTIASRIAGFDKIVVNRLRQEPVAAFLSSSM